MFDIWLSLELNLETFYIKLATPTLAIDFRCEDGKPLQREKDLMRLVMFAATESDIQPMPYRDFRITLEHR